MKMRRAAIVDPIRTPVGKYLGALADIPAGALAATVLRALVDRTGIDPERVDDVVFAQGYGNGEAPAVGRWAALAAGFPVYPAHMRWKNILLRREARRTRSRFLSPILISGDMQIPAT